MVGLGDITATPFTSRATDISADGRTIYGYSAAPDINEQGWVWTEATGMRTLDDLLINDYGLGEQLEGWRSLRQARFPRAPPGRGGSAAPRLQGRALRWPLATFRTPLRGGRTVWNCRARLLSRVAKVIPQAC